MIAAAAKKEAVTKLLTHREERAGRYARWWPRAIAATLYPFIIADAERLLGPDDERTRRYQRSFADLTGTDATADANG